MRHPIRRFLLFIFLGFTLVSASEPVLSDDQRKADNDAKRNADADAKRAADDQRKADNDAKRKADADAKKAADDAKRAADDQRKADNDARRKADADAKKAAAEPAPADDTPPSDPAQLKQWLARQQEKSRQQLEEMRQQAAAPEAPSRTRRNRKPLIVLPARNDSKLSLLPAAPLTEATLAQNAAGMVQDLRAGLDQADLKAAEPFLAKYAGSSGALTSVAAVAWVQKSPGVALLLAAEAVRTDPSDWNAVNTLGALLSQAGYGHMAIPLLQYQVAHRPNDARAHNNLGQAWLAMGEIEKAEAELKKSLLLFPALGAAHASLGAIAYVRGDQAGARAHAEAAAQSDLSPTARRILDEQGVSLPISKSWDNLVARTEYFSPSHFKPPAPQHRGEEGRMKRAELDAFADFLRAKIGELKAEAASRDQQLKKLSADEKTKMTALMMATPPTGAMAEKAQIRIAQAEIEKQDVVDAALKRYNENIADLRQQKDADLRRLSAKYSGGSDTAGGQAGGDPCAEKKQIIDHFLDACADRYGKLEDVVLPIYQRRVNTVMANLAIAHSGPAYQVAFAAEAAQYLGRVSTVASMQVVEDFTCGARIAGAGQAPSGELPRMTDCPFKLNAEVAPAGYKVLVIHIDCQNFGFDFNAVLFDVQANKNFISGETSLGLGISEEWAGPGSLVKGKAEAMLVMSWDRNNNLNFVGVEMGMEASLNGVMEGRNGPEKESGPPRQDQLVKLKVEGGAEPPSSPLSADTFGGKYKSVLGVTIGPEGLTPDLHGSLAAEVLGQQIFKHELK